MHHYIKAVVALLSIPTLISARSNLYARYAEAEAIAGPYAYPDAVADAYADPYDEPTYLSKRDVEGIVYLARRDAYAEAYADALAFAEPYAAADYEGFSVYERSPVPTDLTPEEKKKCLDLKGKATSRYKAAQTDYEAAVRAYNKASKNTKQAEAKKAYDAAKRERDGRKEARRQCKKMGEDDIGHDTAIDVAQANMDKYKKLM